MVLYRLGCGSAEREPSVPSHGSCLCRTMFPVLARTVFPRFVEVLRPVYHVFFQFWMWMDVLKECHPIFHGMELAEMSFQPGS